ncbi:MAG TPA: hypothetical protein VIL31_10075 [Cyclobacteriaceae bacterium]|jgi:hypothetical protein
MKSMIAGAVALSLATVSLKAQDAPDTVVINLTKSSKVVLTIGDSTDLQTLRNYDFQQLFDDVLDSLEGKSIGFVPYDSSDEKTETYSWERNDDDDEWDDWDYSYSERRWRTTQSFNFDLGTSNFLSDGKFPDSENAPYAVRPWGSWYLGINSIQRTRIGKNFFVEWGLGVSWYNFKFQEDNMTLVKDDVGVTFTPDMRDADFRKSKLTVSYVNASIVPVLDFSNRSNKGRWDATRAFRIGAGPYIGYKIDSYTKIKYKLNGSMEKDRNHDGFYMENIRYGMRMQIGYRSLDLFFNYDMNELFSEGKGPSLNAFSFGVVF